MFIVTHAYNNRRTGDKDRKKGPDGVAGERRQPGGALPHPGKQGADVVKDDLLPVGFGHGLEIVPVPVRQGLVVEDMDADGPLRVVEDGLHDDARMPGILSRRIVVGQSDMNGFPGDIHDDIPGGFH